MKTFKVSIINPEKIIYDSEVVSLIVPAKGGYLGILADHAPLAAVLTAGKITLRKSGASTPKIFNYKGKGFLEVIKNNVTLLLTEGVS